MTTTTAPFTRRILSVYRAATPEDHTEGTRWYREARDFAATLDDNVVRAVAVIAVLSPMTSWPRNQTLARNHYAGVFGGCLSDSTLKAQRILAGEDHMSVMGGKKVTAFFHNIMGSSDYVTLDRHAVDIAIGRPLSDEERAYWLTVRRRRILSQAYINASKRVGVSPSTVQAVTWVAWRKTRAQAFHVNG